MWICILFARQISNCMVQCAFHWLFVREPTFKPILQTNDKRRFLCISIFLYFWNYYNFNYSWYTMLSCLIIFTLLEQFFFIIEFLDFFSCCNLWKIACGIEEKWWRLGWLKVAFRRMAFSVSLFCRNSHDFHFSTQNWAVSNNWPASSEN